MIKLLCAKHRGLTDRVLYDAHSDVSVSDVPVGDSYVSPTNGKPPLKKFKPQTVVPKTNYKRDGFPYLESRNVLNRLMTALQVSLIDNVLPGATRRTSLITIFHFHLFISTFSTCFSFFLFLFLEFILTTGLGGLHANAAWRAASAALAPSTRRCFAASLIASSSSESLSLSLLLLSELSELSAHVGHHDGHHGGHHGGRHLFYCYCYCIQKNFKNRRTHFEQM